MKYLVILSLALCLFSCSEEEPVKPTSYDVKFTGIGDSVYGVKVYANGTLKNRTFWYNPQTKFDTTITVAVGDSATFQVYSSGTPKAIATYGGKTFSDEREKKAVLVVKVQN